MKVTQEKLPESQIGLAIEIPAETSKLMYERTVNDLARTIKLPGFRKGKIPRQVLIQRIGAERIRAEVVETLIQDSLQKALKQEKIDPLGNYQLVSDINELVKAYQPGEALTFTASVDVNPEVKLGEYTGLKVQAEKIEYNPAKVDEFLEEKRAEQAILAPVEGRPAQEGDVAMVDYEGRIPQEGEAEDILIEGAAATDFQMELTSGQFLDDLVNGIKGMNVGETKEIPVDFPENYAREDLAGVSTRFTVTLKELKEKELPELDDDFAEEISEFSTVAELREHLEKRYQNEAEEATNANIEEALVEALLEVVEVDLPKTLVSQEVDALLQQTAMRMSQYGVDVRSLFTQEMIPQLRENSRPEAIKRLSTSLALAEIAKQEGLTPDEQKVNERVQEVLTQLKDRQEVDPSKLREFVVDELLQNQAIDWLKEKAVVDLVPEGTLSQPEEEEVEEQAEEAASEATVDVEATAE
ncbi:trigger factor [Spirulina subsalsa FACHB-351]|uniref:Trigger factor n=1 Tax=Spirulina subsalsa FACHB-351 TaxID=234711 RepID=A0ABT3L3B0_9CYAN|nr:trigger factor [Spirulina subsalsa]MCW6035991.1 trigger factor [Spirulina subsalsa FACHB-351]